MKALFILFLLLPAMSLVDSHKRDFEQVDESFDSENMKYIPEKQRELDDKYKLNEENSMMKKTIAAIHQRDGGMEDDNESYDKENSKVEKSKFRQKSSLVEGNRYYNKTRDVDRLKQEDIEKMKYQTYDSLQKWEDDDKSDYDVNDNNDDEKNEYKNDGAYLNDDDDDDDDDENEDKNDDIDDDDIDDNYDSDVDDDNNGNIHDKDIDDKSNDDNDMNDDDHDDDVEGDDNKKITSRESYSNEHRENKKESTHNTDKKNSINNKEKSYESKNYDNEENSGTLHLIKNKADKGINHVNEKQNDTEDKHDKNNKEKNVIKDGNDNSNLDSPTLEVKIKQDNNSDVKTRKSKMKIQNGSLKTRANNKTAKDDDVDNSKRKTEHKMENHSTHKNKKSRKNYKVQKGLNRKYDNAMNEYFRTQKQLANTIHKTKDDEKPLNKTDLSFLEANEFSIEKTKYVKDDKEKNTEKKIVMNHRKNYNNKTKSNGKKLSNLKVERESSHMTNFSDSNKMQISSSQININNSKESSSHVSESQTKEDPGLQEREEDENESHGDHNNDKNSAKNKLIQRKVEQLSMSKDDESEEEAVTLGTDWINNDKKLLDMMGDKKMDDETKKNKKITNQMKYDVSKMENHKDKEKQYEDYFNVNKVDVVNSLLRVGSNGDSPSDSNGKDDENVYRGKTPNDVVEKLGYKDTTIQDKKNNLERLLQNLVPTGKLPKLPKGFKELSKTIGRFAHKVDENNRVTVTSNIKEPIKLFDGMMNIGNAMLQFSYHNKEEKDEKWQFKATGTWMNGEQEINVVLESSKQDDHFTLMGTGDSLALQDYFSIYVTNAAFAKSGINMAVFEEMTVSNAELYVVFNNLKNIVSLVSGNITYGDETKPIRCQTFIEKFPGKDPVFAILMDFAPGSGYSVLKSLMKDEIAKIPFVNNLLSGKNLFKVAEGGFGFAASSSDIERHRLSVFGEGMLDRDLDSHITPGITLTIPILFNFQNSQETDDIITRLSNHTVSFFPTKSTRIDLSRIFKTLSKSKQPKISNLGYLDVNDVFLKELKYDLNASLYTILGSTTRQLNIAPGMIYLDEGNLEFRQQVPHDFSTLALYGSGSAKVGQAKLNISLHTDVHINKLLINGEAYAIWSPDIASTFGITMEIDDDVRWIMDNNQMLNINLENVHMFTVVKNGESSSVHFTGFLQPISWNDVIQVEIVVFHDSLLNKRRMITGYLFHKLPLTYAIDALGLGKFSTPRFLDNSRNSMLVISPINTQSMFINPAFNGLSFMQGLSLVGEFRLPDVCTLNVVCESAVQFLGTENWYRVQGLVSSRGYKLVGNVDRNFILAKELKLTNNILEFAIGKYSDMTIATEMNLENNNLTFRGYVNFEPNGMRLRMSSNDVWSHPFARNFLTFDRLSFDTPLISGITLNELKMTGELKFGLQGSLYAIFAPAYVTFKLSEKKMVSFQATMTNITLETIINALNFKSSLPDVLLNSRFHQNLILRFMPKEKPEDQNLDFYGKMEMLSRTFMVKLQLDGKKRITGITSHSEFPLLLDGGLITVCADQNHKRFGPRALFTITPKSTTFKVDGFVNFMGLAERTKIEVGEFGTQFSLRGSLFGTTKTITSFMSPDSLAENGPYIASACLPDIIPHVTTRVNLLLAAAADQAEQYIKQAISHYEKATEYHKKALEDEHEQIFLLDEGENDVENDNKQLFIAEEQYNKTCVEKKCTKTCIGCPSWINCCDHDVFGNCVKCPTWKPCCWHGKNPICKAKNHACRIMKKFSAEKLQEIARRVYVDKEKKIEREKVVWKSEYTKGKTEAILEAAQRALNLVNQDSVLRLQASNTIKRYGLEKLVDINSVCFHTTLKTLATSCLTLNINATFANEHVTKSLPYYGCLNKELVSKMANHITQYMLRDKSKNEVNSKHTVAEKTKSGDQRSGNLFGMPLYEEKVDLPTNSPEVTYARWRRDDANLNNDEEMKPFWSIRNNFKTHVLSLLQQRAAVPRSPLKKKWQIPASRKGKCRVYRQLVEICKDMMETVNKMFQSFKDGKGKFNKRLTELQLGLNITINDLEKQVMDIPEMQDRLSDIEMNIRNVGSGVNKWKKNCESDQEDQNKMAIQEWVAIMEERIRRLGGQGVDRFLSNLFRAFEGMFLGTDTPKRGARKILNTLHSIREISAMFHDIFGNSEITLEKAGIRAEIVMSKLKLIKDTQMFCDN